MRLTLFILALWPMVVFSSPKNSIVHESVTSFESGIACDPPTRGSFDAPGTVDGKIYQFVDDLEFLSHSHVVPAVLGMGFGTKTQMEATEGLSGVTMIVTHPPMGPDRVTQQTHINAIRGDRPSRRLYAFDFDYEVLIGTWQLRAEKDGQTIYSATFEVVPPDKVPELAQICGYEHMLS